MPSVREELLTYFTHVLLGDALAAEYLILHLISNVYVKSSVCNLPDFVWWFHAKAGASLFSLQVHEAGCSPAGQVHLELEWLSYCLIHRAPLSDHPAARAFCELSVLLGLFPVALRCTQFFSFFPPCSHTIWA